MYLVSGKKCIEKAKTTTARKTLDPLYQQQLVFREPFAGCILQVLEVGGIILERRVIAFASSR